MKFYVYEHWRPDTNMPFYVGKGSGRRAKTAGGRKRNKHHTHIINKLMRLGMCFDIKIIHENLTEQEAFDLEIERISFWRTLGVPLTNMTNGGEGASGFSVPESTREKIRESLKGRKRPEISAMFKGRKASEAARANMSAAQKGKPMSEKARAAFKVRSGWNHSEDTIARMRARVFSEEHRAKISAAKKGHTVSEETRAKISAAGKRRFARIA